MSRSSESSGLQRDETVLGQFEHQLSRKHDPFGLTITDQALHILKKRFFAIRDPWYYERVPLTAVRRLHIRRLRSAGWVLLAIVCVAVGGYTTYGMFTDAYVENGGRASGWPVAMLVGGLILPFVVRGRYALEIVYASASYVWKPPLVLGSVAREGIDRMLTQIRDVAKGAGVLVQDERTADF